MNVFVRVCSCVCVCVCVYGVLALCLSHDDECVWEVFSKLFVRAIALHMLDPQTPSDVMH